MKFIKFLWVVAILSFTSGVALIQIELLFNEYSSLFEMLEQTFLATSFVSFGLIFAIAAFKGFGYYDSLVEDGGNGYVLSHRKRRQLII